MEEVKNKEDDISQLVKSADDFKDQSQVIVSKFVLSVRLLLSLVCTYLCMMHLCVCVWGGGVRVCVCLSVCLFVRLPVCVCVCVLQMLRGEVFG